MSSTTSPGASSDPTMLQPTNIGVFKYNGACVAFFSIVGIVLQVPVIISHCGFSGRPNIPVVILSAIYAYLCLSFSITAISWTSNEPSQWWSGKGWCDLDVRVFLAVSLAVLSTQCVINWNMLSILRENVKISSRTQTWRRSLCEALACLFLPIVNLSVSTFTMQNRFGVVQYMGCLANVDFSVAYIVTFLIWLPILGLSAMLTIFLIAFRFWRRGKSASIESISFIPHMSFAQFVRMIIFSLVISIILGPLSISLSVINFINVGKVGVHKLAWLHGKPKNWDTITYILLEEIPMPAHVWSSRPTFILDTITRYINISIAWLLFLCYGTGSLAQQSYALTYRKLLRMDPPHFRTKETTEMDSFHTGDDSPTDTTFEGSLTSAKFNEWDTAAVSGNKLLHVWEDVVSAESADYYEHTPESLFNAAHSKAQMPHILPVRSTTGPIGGLLGGMKRPFIDRSSI